MAFCFVASCVANRLDTMMCSGFASDPVPLLGLVDLEDGLHEIAVWTITLLGRASDSCILQ
jgi:hypothetical protein